MVKKLFTSLALVVLLNIGATVTFSQSIDDLEETIQEREKRLQDIDAQIAEDKKRLEQLEGQKNTLNKTLNNLNFSEKTIERTIFSTVTDIKKTEEEIDNLGTQVLTLQEQIDQNSTFIRETIRLIHRDQEKSFWEVILLFDTFSDYLDRITQYEQTSKLIHQKNKELNQTREIVVSKTEEQTKKIEELVDLTEELQDQKKVVEITKQEKQKVLNQTKNQEKNYQVALAEKLDLKRAFEQELLELESKLQIAIDKTKYAGRSQGLFSWPTSSFRVTQYFGNTDFARGGAYNGRGHSGVDFGVPIGTPVRAVMDGTVRAAFDTDSVGARGSDGRYRQCVSYGKYVLVEHDNGLSTLVAHNSLIKVDLGDRVKRGDIIAYSGNSGYSTGPHLHFSTYATQGVQVKKLGDVSPTTVYCKEAVIPIISLNAYLDPFDYLPRPKFAVKQVRLGDSSTAVRELQMMLKHERMFPIEVPANGVYGPTTAAAVLEWGNKYGVDTKKGERFDQKAVERYEKFFD